MKELKEKIWRDFIETFPQYEDTTPDFDAIDFEEEELEYWQRDWVLQLEGIRFFEEYTTVENAKDFLESKGYYVDNLWTVRAIQDRYTMLNGSEVSDITAQHFLNEVLPSERIINEINEALSMVVEDFLIEKEDNVLGLGEVAEPNV